MKVISLKGNDLTIDLNEKEYNFFFRVGLQIFADKKCKNKVTVLPVSEKEKFKNVKNKYEIPEILVEEFVKDGLLQVLRQLLTT